MTYPEKSRRTILVGEDDAEIRNYLEVMLGCRGYNIQAADDGEEVIRYLQTGLPVAAVLLDIMMPNKDGFETLREIRALHEELPVIMLSGASSPNNVVQAIKGGAVDFVAKPVDHDDLVRVIERAVQAESSPPASSQYTGDDRVFFGGNPVMRELKGCLPKLADSRVPVLIQGETGTGKEILARHIHLLSPRGGQPFVKLNCAAVPSELMESELFGYERGAFTGALERKPGLFELADGGTILLDEIGDMEIRLQAKLLQVLQDHEFRRLGGKSNVHVNVRIIAATHQNLQESIRDGKFREDLFYRLNTFTIELPPLRDRKQDIPLLAEYFLHILVRR